MRSWAVAYLCTSFPLGHSIIDKVPERFGGNSAISVVGC